MSLSSPDKHMRRIHWYLGFLLSHSYSLSNTLKLKVGSQDSMLLLCTYNPRLQCFISKISTTHLYRQLEECPRLCSAPCLCDVPQWNTQTGSRGEEESAKKHFPKHLHKCHFCSKISRSKIKWLNYIPLSHIPQTVSPVTFGRAARLNYFIPLQVSLVINWKMAALVSDPGIIIARKLSFAHKNLILAGLNCIFNQWKKGITFTSSVFC